MGWPWTEPWAAGTSPSSRSGSLRLLRRAPRRRMAAAAAGMGALLGWTLRWSSMGSSGSMAAACGDDGDDRGKRVSVQYENESKLSWRLAERQPVCRRDGQQQNSKFPASRVRGGGGGRSRKGQDKQAAANGACFIFNWGISSTTTQLWFLILMLVRLCSEWGALTRSYSIPRPLSHHTLSESPFKSLLLMRFASMAFTSCHHRPRSCLRPHRCSACCARRPPGRAKQSRRLGL